ncbi:MAG: hypothetical protein JKY84_11905 [Emcibacteraceae bacterium]|nr:hypothetical protein [Emcibacteraceae bacterium]
MNDEFPPLLDSKPQPFLQTLWDASINAISMVIVLSMVWGLILAILQIMGIVHINWVMLREILLSIIGLS